MKSRLFKRLGVAALRPEQDRDACAGMAMIYNVTQDTVDGFMNQKWLKPYAQNGIPTTFVIDQSGNVVWIGQQRPDREGRRLPIEVRHPCGN